MHPVLLLALFVPPPAADPTAPTARFPAAVQWPAALASVRIALKTGGLATGSGVVVGHRDGCSYVLTAAHVVAEPLDWELESFTRRSYPVPATVHKSAVVVVRRADPDIALLKVPTDTPMLAARLAGPRQRPRTFPTEALAVGCDDGRPPRCAVVTLRARRLVRDELAGSALRGFFWETSEGAVQGRSGGPLFDSDGRVIGLCSGVKEESGRAYYTHLDEILAALAKSGYAWLWEK